MSFTVFASTAEVFRTFGAQNVNGRELVGVLDLRYHVAVRTRTPLHRLFSSQILLHLLILKLGKSIFWVAMQDSLPDMFTYEEFTPLAYTLSGNHFSHSFILKFCQQELGVALRVVPMVTVRIKQEFLLGTVNEATTTSHLLSGFHLLISKDIFYSAFFIGRHYFLLSVIVSPVVLHK